MKVTCDVIKDLLPLYSDEVCSEDSKQLVENHLAACEDCQNDLRMMKASFELGQDHREKNDENRVLERIALSWKHDRRQSFLLGILVFGMISAMGSFITYFMVGASVDANGILVEPFALLPIGYLMILLVIISGISLLVNHVRKR